jgi:1,4-dihydroxy-2-naphthoate octaprenyltransferase
MSTATISTERVGPVLDVARARFLLLPVTLVALGAAAASATGAFDPVRTALALVGLVALHVAINAFNEASDYERGIDLETDPTPFSGGSGRLPEGDLHPTTARWLGIAGSAVGVVVGAYFLVVVGPVLLPVVALGAATVLGYTDFFARKGLGEVAAGLGLGALPVIGVALVQNGQLGAPAVAAAVPAFLLTFNLLLLNEFPDEDPDRRGGRLNLVHALGRERAARAYLAVALLVPVSIVAAVTAGVLGPLALFGVVPSVLLYRPAEWAIRRPSESVPLSGLQANVAWILTTNLALAVGIAFPAAALTSTLAMTVNEGLYLVGRVLFGGVLAMMGVNNLADLDGVAGQMAEKGLPFPKVATVAASVPLVASAVAIATGVYAWLGAAYLIVFMLAATIVVHDFWAIDDPDEKENELFHFLKNVLILGAAVLVLSLTIPA